MDILNPLAEQYCTQFSSDQDVLLQEIEAHTNQHHGHAHMLSGKWQGKFLEMISMMINPTKVLEIGSFTGFSALCLSKGLTKDGHLHTIEIREEDAKTAQQFFEPLFQFFDQQIPTMMIYNHFKMNPRKNPHTKTC